MVNEDYVPYRVMDASEYPPGNCFVTGSATGPFLDTGIYIPKERFGQLVLGKAFIEEAARLFGLFDGEQERIEAAYAAGVAEGVKEELSGSLDRAVDTLGYVVDALRDLAGSGDMADLAGAVGSPDVPEPAAVGGDPATDRGASTKRAAKRAAGQGDHAAEREGPAELPAGAGHESAFRV